MHTSSTHTHTHRNRHRARNAHMHIELEGVRAAPQHTHTQPHVHQPIWRRWFLCLQTVRKGSTHAIKSNAVVEVMYILWGREEEENKKSSRRVLTFSKSNRNGEAAHSTILWAGKLRPPAASVQSTRSPWQRNNCMADTRDVP